MNGSFSRSQDRMESRPDHKTVFGGEVRILSRYVRVFSCGIVCIILGIDVSRLLSSNITFKAGWFPIEYGKSIKELSLVKDKENLKILKQNQLIT